jgi:transcriptional regulator with XRE-family HTH domain
MRIGEQIVILRENMDMTQKELAEHLHIHNSVLNRIELGLRAVRDDELKKIANYFNTSADYLLGRVDDPRPIAEIIGKVSRYDTEMGRAVQAEHKKEDAKKEALYKAYCLAPQAVKDIVDVALAPYQVKKEKRA